MKRVITLFAVLLMGWSVNAWSFACKTANGTAIPIGGGSANVYVNLAPAVNVGQNLVVDLSTQIFCHNDYPETITDYVTLQRGSAYGGVLSNFSGTVKYSGSSYPFPTTSETPRVVYNSRTDKPWPVALYLTPVSSAGGVAIKAGSLIAVLILRQTNNYNSDDFQFVWNIYANNDVVVPTGGCDVSARDVTVTLPDYPGSVPPNDTVLFAGIIVPLRVNCTPTPCAGENDAVLVKIELPASAVGTLALCRPDKTRQRRIWHKQSALCWSVPPPPNPRRVRVSFRR